MDNYGPGVLAGPSLYLTDTVRCTMHNDRRVFSMQSHSLIGYKNVDKERDGNAEMDALFAIIVNNSSTFIHR